MKRLSGWDAGFLNQELPIQPMNPMAIAVLEPGVDHTGSPDPITMEYLHEHMARRLGELPSFRWRLKRVPFGLHHPVYLEDPDFDLAYHLRHATLPAPGGDRELDRFVCDLAECHLDRRRPLWQLTLVEGLAGGRQAVVLLFHHCLADGIAASTVFARVFSGLDHQVTVPSEPWQPDRVPSSLRLIVDAVSDLFRMLPRLVRLVAKTVSGLLAVRAHRRSATVKAPLLFIDTAPCSLNNAYTLDRVFTRALLSLRDVKEVKSVAGGTLNDVVLAILAGAFRRYLVARNDLPEVSLTASVPVALDPPDAPPRQSGNWFTGLTTTLATDIDDPWERLSRIVEVTKASKVEFEILGSELLTEWLEFLPPWVAEPTARLVHRRRPRSPDKREMVNLLVSNLRGPDKTWSFGSASVAEFYIAGPPSNGVGSIVVVWSYADQLSFGIVSFADSMSDPVGLGKYLQESLDELVLLAREREVGFATG